MLHYDPTTFPSHAAVICLNCRTALGDVEEEFQLTSLGIGRYKKKCPKCHLSTSYDVTPREASALVEEEPIWRDRFEEHCARWPKLPRYLAEDSAFEATLRDWRSWHKPASASDGMVALAALKIYPPRNLIRDVPRDGECFAEQHDAHCWLSMSQRAWKIVAIEDRIMICDSFGEQTQVNLSRAKWEKHSEKAIEVLNAIREAEKNRETQSWSR